MSSPLAVGGVRAVDLRRAGPAYPRSPHRLSAREQRIDELVGLERPQILEPFADFAAIAINNARNFQRIEELTLIDEWTCLYNARFLRRCITEEVERANRYHHPVSLVFLDLDFFKQVNDTHGHLTGDAVLKRVGQTLKRGLRGSDAIGRYGVEEFLFFLPETDLDGGAQVAEKLRSLVEDLTDSVEGAEGLRITISIGVGELDHSDSAGQSVDAVIAAADEKLLAAKREGRNRVVPGPLAAA